MCWVYIIFFWKETPPPRLQQEVVVSATANGIYASQRQRGLGVLIKVQMSDRVDRNKKIFDLRRRNFSRNMVMKLGFLGYLIIIFKYLKYGTNVLSLLFRCVVQALLISPFPDKSYSQWLLARNGLPTSLQGSIPGGFTTAGASGSNNSDSTQTDTGDFALEVLKRKIRAILFNCVLTINILYVVFAILFPTDFYIPQDGIYIDKQNGHQNMPSPFKYGKYMLEGERKGGITFQAIGETLPSSNLSGNLGVILCEALILIAQLLLFCVTCINFAELGYADDDENDEYFINNDGYDGNVLLTTINLHEGINVMLNEKLPITETQTV